MPSRSPPAEPLRAVVVEDHHDLRDAICEQLEHDGWSVRGFDLAEEALLHARAALPSVVLTDLDLGAHHGAAIARELRLDRSTASIAIVAMSGVLDPSPGMRGYFERFLPKPIDLGTLGGILEDAIARRRAR